MAPKTRHAWLAAHLLNQYPSPMQVKIFENRQGRQAHREVLEMLDADRDGELSDREKRTARTSSAAYSWGASGAITLARALGQDRIPVLLTIQVDRVTKLAEDDRWIPANVGHRPPRDSGRPIVREPRFWEIIEWLQNQTRQLRRPNVHVTACRD
jgi:hypothetical protein